MIVRARRGRRSFGQSPRPVIIAKSMRPGTLRFRGVKVRSLTPPWFDRDFPRNGVSCGSLSTNCRVERVFFLPAAYF